jgi:hypothetical protein
MDESSLTGFGSYLGAHAGRMGSAARQAERGVIYVEVPNYHSAYIRWFGVRTNAFGVPFHLIHFSRRSLRRVVEAAGLSADISQKELPWMGSAFSALLGQEHRFGYKLIGAALQPLQVLLDFAQGKPCLAAICWP